MYIIIYNLSCLDLDFNLCISFFPFKEVHPRDIWRIRVDTSVKHNRAKFSWAMKEQHLNDTFSSGCLISLFWLTHIIEPATHCIADIIMCLLELRQAHHSLSSLLPFPLLLPSHSFEDFLFLSDTDSTKSVVLRSYALSNKHSLSLYVSLSSSSHTLSRACFSRSPLLSSSCWLENAACGSALSPALAQDASVLPAAAEYSYGGGRAGTATARGRGRRRRLRGPDGPHVPTDSILAGGSGGHGGVIWGAEVSRLGIRVLLPYEPAASSHRVPVAHRHGSMSSSARRVFCHRTGETLFFIHLLFCTFLSCIGPQCFSGGSQLVLLQDFALDIKLGLNIWAQNWISVMSNALILPCLVLCMVFRMRVCCVSRSLWHLLKLAGFYKVRDECVLKYHRVWLVTQTLMSIVKNIWKVPSPPS